MRHSSTIGPARTARAIRDEATVTGAGFGHRAAVARRLTVGVLVFGLGVLWGGQVDARQPLSFHTDRIVLRPAFDPRHYEYTAPVVRGFSGTTSLTQGTTSHGATTTVKLVAVNFSDREPNVSGLQAAIPSRNAITTLSFGVIPKGRTRRPWDPVYRIRVVRLPELTLAVDTNSISENGGVARVTGTAAAAMPSDFTLAIIPYQQVVAEGSGTVGVSPADFTLSSEVMHFAKGATTSTEPVTITAVDNDYVNPVDFVLRVTGHSYENSYYESVGGVHVLRIIDDEADPALTAYWSGQPPTHNGTPFTVGIKFSEAISATAEELRSAISATGATVTAAALAAGSDTLWTLTVTPSGTGSVSLLLPVTTDCDDPGAICTSGGRMFASRLALTLPFASQLSVADNAAHEGTDTTLDFTVTLAPAVSDATVTVDYATADGTATAGQDYTATTGTLSFAPNETAKTVSVPIIDDQEQDGGETFTLTLSNPINAVLADAEATGTINNTELTARLESAPASHDGETPFTLRLAFSEDVETGYKTLRDRAFTVRGGAVTRAARVGPRHAKRNDLWDITVKPSARTDIEVVLPATSSCAAAGAVCTAAGRALSAPAKARVRGPAGLTARFEGAPEEHDGAAAFTVRLVLSEPAAVSAAGLRDHALAVDAGRVSAVRGLDDAGTRWEVSVQPPVAGAVTLSLAATASCTDAGAVCTRAGKALAGAAAVRIEGPAPLTAQFGAAPANHDGVSLFTVRLAFNHPIATKHRALRDTALAVSGGTPAKVSLVDGRRDLWEVSVWPSSINAVRISLAPPGACSEAGAVCTATGNALSAGAEVEVAGPDPGSLPALTAGFESVPAHHTVTSPFTLRLRFNAPVTASPATLQGALAVTSGSVASVARVKRRADLWTVEVTPSGSGEVGLSLAAVTSCEAAGAVCTSDGRALSAAASATVPGPDRVTARWYRTPTRGHNGRDLFNVEIKFSAPVTTGFTTMRDHVPAVTNGTVEKASRVGGSTSPWAHWRFHIRPSSHRDVTIALRATASCSDTGAVCTPDGGALSEAPEPLLVGGPAALSVSDARADEGEGATLDFKLTMNRSPYEALTVTYETRDGTATAGADYTATSGTLTFGVDDLEKTVSVPVLDDAHDEGEETMTFVVTGIQGANSRLLDGEGEGTIQNDDPLQQAWLARFGRTVGTHVTDAIGARLRGDPDQGSHLTVGGYRLPLGRQQAPEPGAGEATPDSPWLNGPGPDPRLGQSRTLDVGETFDPRRVLLGSSFRLALGADDADSSHPRLTAWGRFAGTTFDGQDGDLTLDGDVFTGTVGVDGTWDRWLAGVAVAHSRGDGSFTTPGVANRGRGDLEQTLTSLHPYLRYAVTERLAVWGSVGYGGGEVDVEFDNGTNIETDTTMMMGAFGGRGILFSPAAGGGFQLATRTDAMLTRTSADAATNSAATDADAHRLRVILEGSRAMTLDGGRSFTPTVELGLRHDWGDAETGFGLEVGGRVRYADPRLGLTVDARVRGLLAHEDADYREWGASGTVRLAPGTAGQGLMLTLSPAWGAAQSGVEGLWTRQTTQGLASNQRGAARGRLNAEVGYGFANFEMGRVTPYAGTVLVGGADRTYRVGLRWTGVTGLTVDLEGRRQELAGAQPNQGLQLQATWAF